MPRPPMDLSGLLPEYTALARETTLLNPAPGDPGPGDSSMGGPLLWPAAEPWPHCAREGHWTYADDGRSLEEITPGRTPMVPVLQLYARDVPQPAFPTGTDVLQLVWCALHHDDNEDGPMIPQLHWRNEAEVIAAGTLTDIPRATDFTHPEDLMPTPSTLTPTPDIDYPGFDLPYDLQQTWEKRLHGVNGLGTWSFEDGCAIATKAGGYPAWTQPPNWPTCVCARRMEHLLTITGDIQLGDCGGFYVFLCRHCPDTPYAYRYDCH
ncbi:hypothetical protein SRB5_39660 [Streptomyces sp. RB5]|uniref:DUF1963 domain-containing protein n=1 Tax=Streptomyces smaragdinus TaxID=2585196 RepID=A0A7K0CK79_9ACTN|nr:hypothetical protein [Streptomyces smaragdinus]MQY13811.1 hypothetical protein [Streptomyces smaragdinus]